MKKTCPYTYELGSSLWMKLSTSSRAQLRILFVKGGAEFSGKFFHLKTTPKAILKYYNSRSPSKRKILLIAKWTAERFKT